LPGGKILIKDQRPPKKTDSFTVAKIRAEMKKKTD